MTQIRPRTRARPRLQWPNWQRSRTVVALALVVGVACSWFTPSPTGQGDRARGPQAVEPPPPIASSAPGEAAQGADPSAPPVAATPGPWAVLARSVGELPAGLVQRLTAVPGVAAVSAVSAGVVLLRRSRGRRGRRRDRCGGAGRARG